MKTQKTGQLANLQYDLPASVVVFLVAVPLCLGIALASGAPLFSGIIAGIVGYKLAKPSLFKAMYAQGRMEFIPFIVTILGIVFTDLLTGIGLGMVVAIYFILYKNYEKPFFVGADDYHTDGKMHLQLAENVSFLNKASINRSLSKLPGGLKVIIDASNTKDIHPDVVEIIRDFKEGSPSRDIEVNLIGFNGFANEKPLKKFAATLAPYSNGEQRPTKLATTKKLT